MPVARFQVPEISCEGCANAIKRALSPQPGIRSVDVDIDGKIARVDYDENLMDPSDIRDRISEAGYDTIEMPEE